MAGIWGFEPHFDRSYPGGLSVRAIRMFWRGLWRQNPRFSSVAKAAAAAELSFRAAITLPNASA
jgi:hypothetical protein